ncbi:MAG: hypothetical protein P1U34_08205 [Coxiellaceae bacterium]|nr:hypothetical protein [Coxiellaceae bacterium]
MRRQQTTDNTGKNAISHFKAVKQAELERINAIAASLANMKWFCNWMFMGVSTHLLLSSKVLSTFWQEYTDSFEQALFQRSEQKYAEGMRVFTESLSSVFNVAKATRLATKYDLSEAVNQCLGQMRFTEFNALFGDASMKACYSGYLGEMIAVFRGGRAAKDYQAFSAAYQIVVRKLSGLVIDLDVREKMSSLKHLGSVANNAYYLRNMQQDIFSVLPSFYKQQETLAGKLAVASNSSIQAIFGSVAQAFSEHKMLLVFSFSLLAVLGYAWYWAADMLCVKIMPPGELKADQSREEALRKYKAETKAAFEPASCAAGVTLAAMSLVAVSSMFLYASVRSSEESVSYGVMASLSLAVLSVLTLLYNPLSGLLTRDENKYATHLGKQLKANLAKRGVNLKVTVEEVTAGKRKAFFLRLSCVGGVLTSFEKAGMLRYVTDVDPRAQSLSQYADGEVIISTTVNIKALESCLNYYVSLAKVSRTMRKALTEIKRQVVARGALSIKEEFGGGDTYGICEDRVLEVDRHVVIDIKKLRLVFPESNIQFTSDDKSVVRIKGLSAVNAEALAAWLQEVEAARRMLTQVFVEDHRPATAQSVTRRRVTGAAAVRARGAVDGFVDDPAPAPRRVRESKYPHDFMYHHTDGHDYRATKIDFVDDKRRVAYMACALTVRQTKNSQRLAALQFAVGGVLRCGRNNNVNKYGEEINDCTARGGDRVPGSYELRIMSGPSKGRRGLATCVGSVSIAGDREGRVAPLHLIVDVPNSLTKHHGKRR